jgi:protein subunit release factor B
MIRLFLKRGYNSKIWTFEEATAWQQGFNKKAIPKEHVTVSFSRSSGPGGQNVNKGKLARRKNGVTLLL